LSRIRVLVVDDSATMRGLITAALERDPRIEVCGTAGDALEARQAIKALNPDVVTLDIEMPNMNGLDFLDKIMRLRPMPVIMVSTQTQAGAAATLAALEIGALDCVAKPTMGAGLNGFSDLAEKIKAAATARVRPRGEATPIQAPRRGFRNNGRVIAIGASTGGVEALLTVLAEFPADCPPTVVVQHMPASFTHSFAQRLNRACAARVSEAVDGDLLTPGRIYIAPGGEQHLEVAGTASPRCRLVEGPAVSGHRPSVDRLFNAVAATVGERALGIVLTGMGRDGAQGLLALRNAGARTLGQDEASSVIYGMPKAAFDIGAVERRLPLRKIASAALDICAADQAEAS
jgi:two-component system chemotaxis response regulator CheB